jgi:outer membrane receptor for ferrienterochelin and colicin
MAFKAGSSTNVNLMGSFGDWIYEGDASYSLTTETSGGDRSTTSGNLTLSEVKVGRSPQTTFGISFDTKISDDFSLDMRYNYFDDHYGFINIDNVFEASIAGTGYEGEKLDGYGLMDLGVTYDFDAGSNDMRVRLNVYNLLDEVYYSTRQRWGYYYGPPRNFNLSLQYLF